jgi:hypothetical protein
MADIETFQIHMDYSGNLFFKDKGVWVGTGSPLPVYNGARLHPAHVDDQNHIVYRFQGRWQRTNGNTAVFREEPRALDIDLHGNVYVYHGGANIHPSPLPTV